VRLASQALRKNNFKLFSDASSIPGCDETTWETLEKVGLKDKAFLPAKVLAHGDQRKLELGMILAPDPEVLLLDEPTAGMASEQVPDLIELIREVQAQGSKTVILVEHNMNVVMRNSDFITVLHQGQVLAEGKPAEIAKNKEVQTAYLGGLYELDL
jgi:branched-chain amino acid transport system ATP-binding protein